MKALFLTDAGRDVGLGHLSRCIAISDGLKSKQKNLDSIFILNNNDKGYVSEYSKYNIRIKDWHKDRSFVESETKDKDVVVIDSYRTALGVYNFIHKIAKNRIPKTVLVCLDDYNRVEYPPCLIIRPSAAKSTEKIGANPLFSQSQVLFGRKYTLLRKEFHKAPTKKVPVKIRDLLIAFGGVPRYAFVEKVVNEIRKRYDLNIHIAIPKGKEWLKKAKINPSKIYIYENISAAKMLKLMKKADICISGGGQTLLELARVGVPTIAISFAKNQQRNIAELKKVGFIEYAGCYNSKALFSSLSRIFKFFAMDKEMRMRRGKIGRELVDGKGAERVAEVIKKRVEHERRLEAIDIRAIAQKDCRTIWTWRKSPKIRKWSFNSSPISYETHREWFKKKLRDKNSRMYIAQNIMGEPIGQVRFDKVADIGALISVYLNPDFLNNGLGKIVIKSATEHFMREISGIDTVIAKVKPENIASKEAFKKAGYLLSKSRDVSNKNTLVFKNMRFKR